MATINELKELDITETPLVLFDCVLSSGATERWSTHGVELQGHRYEGRVLRHNIFEISSASEHGIDAIARISVSLANADSHFSEIERNVGWKGSRVTVRFVFFDLRQGRAASEAAVLFRGIAEAPEEITESALRLTITNSLNLQRVLLPDVRVERRCPWKFPRTAAERGEAVQGGAEGKYSPFFRCGYSADIEGGAGSLSGEVAFTWCDHTRASCQARGMFSKDSALRDTRRFGGIEFVPPTTLVRSYGEKGSHSSAAVENEARYNDFVPLVYGTVWYAPLIVFSKNDGNLTRMEVLLGMGEIESVLKVVVNNIEIPVARPTNMTATGWFQVVTRGGRFGWFNADFRDGAGNYLGDPYGSMAMISVVVPNRINDGRTLPKIEVLVEGLRLAQFGSDGSHLGESYTNNPAWVLLDILRRCGWRLEDIDLGTFGRAAEYCAETIPASDLHGNAIQVPRFQCNLVLHRRRSAADVIRGIRNGARLFLTYSAGGQLELKVENTLALEEPQKPASSNASSELDGGWPRYEFGDGSSSASGILRRDNGEPAIRLWSRSTSETPNRLSLEFQDALNEYQQDSISVTDLDDMLRTGQEISLALPALGVANFDQAARILKFNLDKSVAGNAYVEFDTSVRGLGLKPGDVITVTYLKEGLLRQPFRITKVAPGMNYRTATIAAQIHQDAWYSDANTQGNSEAGRQAGAAIGMPRPLAGNIVDEHGEAQFEVVEKSSEGADGGTSVTLSVGFVAPAHPVVTGVGIPIVSLAARIDDSGGTLAGGQAHYYAVSAVDSDGGESNLSFVVRATIPDGTNTNRVTLTGLSFSKDTAGFRVYRGENPSQLYRIADTDEVAVEFTDSGLESEAVPPPDANYDHANFYWRLELQPEYAATIYATNLIGSAELGMETNNLRGAVVRITRGTGAGQERTITWNDPTTITVAPRWVVAPDATSYFVVAESGWHFGAAGVGSPVEFEVPNRVGASVQVSGRSANVLDRECAAELSPLTRWRISGAGAPMDADVPGKPTFGLLLRGQGAVELVTIGFASLENTRTVATATLTLNYWDELHSPSRVALSAALSDSDTTIELSAPGEAGAGGLAQIGSEIVGVEQVENDGTRYQVTRGVQGSVGAAHSAGDLVYDLSKKVFVVPFARDFFGSPASGSFSYAAWLLDARIASAELYVTNQKGNSEPAIACYTGSVSAGLRTLSPGEYTIQVEGPMAIQTDAAPPLVVQDSHSVHDIFAVLHEPPVGGAIEMQVRLDETVYCHLTIPERATYSNVVDGFGLAPLAAGGQMNLDILSVPQALNSTPGRDLTVTIRL